MVEDASGPGADRCRLLLIEDNPGDADLVRDLLAGDSPGWTIEHVVRLSDGLTSLSRGGDLVLLDLSLPDAFGLQAVTELVSAFPEIPTVVYTTTDDESVGVMAVELGAQDYLIKGKTDAHLLRRVLRYAMQRHLLARQARHLAQAQAGRAAAEQERRRALLLADASQAASSTLVEEQVLRRLLQTLVPRFGVLGGVEMFKRKRRFFSVVAYADGEGACRMLPPEPAPGAVVPCTVCAVRDVDRCPWCPRGGKARPGARIEEPADDAPPGWQSPIRAIWRKLGVRSRLVLPLGIRDELLGLLTVASQDTYEPEDLLLGEEIARSTAAAIESARLYARALEAVRVRDDFISIAAHDLRSPLTGILLESHVLAKNSALPDPLRQGVERIQRNGQRLLELIEELLDVARMRSGNLQLETAPHDLVSLVRAVVDRAAAQLEDAGCELRIQADCPLRVNADASRLQEVLSNLLQNALRHGAGKPIEMRVEALANRAWVHVRDHGPGIELEQQLGLFEQFSRVPGGSKGPGLRLGLWICRTIIEAHGGSIGVSSEPGEGADFFFEIPLDLPSGDPIPEKDAACEEAGGDEEPEHGRCQPLGRAPRVGAGR